MALEMRAAPRPVSARRSTPDGGAGPVDDGSGRPLTGGLLDPSTGSDTAPIPARIGPKMADLVPHTGIAANVRRVPTEYGCYGGLRLAPVGPTGLRVRTRVQRQPSTKRLTAAAINAYVRVTRLGRCRLVAFLHGVPDEGCGTGSVVVTVSGGLAISSRRLTAVESRAADARLRCSHR
jgi:hypothetical protein